MISGLMLWRRPSQGDRCSSSRRHHARLPTPARAGEIEGEKQDFCDQRRFGFGMAGDENFADFSLRPVFSAAMRANIVMPRRSTAMSRVLIVSANESGERTLMTQLSCRPA